MKITIPFLLVTGAGALLLWCGITDRNPVEVVHAILTGKALPPKGSGTKPKKDLFGGDPNFSFAPPVPTKPNSTPTRPGIPI